MSWSRRFRTGRKGGIGTSWYDHPNERLATALVCDRDLRRAVSAGDVAIDTQLLAGRYLAYHGGPGQHGDRVEAGPVVTVLPAARRFAGGVAGKYLNYGGGTCALRTYAVQCAQRLAFLRLGMNTPLVCRRADGRAFGGAMVTVAAVQHPYTAVCDYALGDPPRTGCSTSSVGEDGVESAPSQNGLAISDCVYPLLLPFPALPSRGREPQDFLWDCYLRSMSLSRMPLMNCGELAVP